MDVPEHLLLLQNKTLASVVKDEMLRMIKTGEIEMGAKLSEISFTSRLNVSRAAVREAFRGLEEAGLVRLEKNRGVFVRKFEKHEAIELFEFRAVLEEASARRLAALITDEQLAELEKLSKELEQLAPNNVLNEYYNLNILFHDNMVVLAGNSAMLETYRRLTDQMHLLRRQGYNKGNGLLQSCAEHRAILNALLRRDPDAVARASHDHVMNGMVRLLAL